MLAGLVRAPSPLAPSRNLEGARRAPDVVLAGDGRHRRARQSQATAARAPSAGTRDAARDRTRRRLFRSTTAEAEVKRLVGNPPLDLTVTTTLDPRAAGRGRGSVVKNWLSAEGAQRARRPGGAGRDGAGRRGPGDGRRPRLRPEPVQPRHPGAAPAGLAVQAVRLSDGARRPAIRRRPRLVDQPVEIGDWQPKNYDEPLSAAGSRCATAFAQSINTVAALVRSASASRKVIDDGARASASIRIAQPVPSLALGSAEVTLLEMTARLRRRRDRQRNASSPTPSARGHRQPRRALYPPGPDARARPRPCKRAA